MKKKGFILGITGTLLAVTGFAGYLYESCVPRKSSLRRKKNDELTFSDPEKQRAYDEARVWFERISKEEVEICSFDDLRLRATFIPAETYTTNTVILVHGYRVSGFKDFGLMLPFYHGLGVNILLPDDRGHGASEGDYIGFGWHDRLDVKKWTEYVLLRFGKRSNIFLHGVSMGGTAVMLASGEDLPVQVRGVIEDCGYSALNEQLRYRMTRGRKIPVLPLIKLASGFAKKKAGYKFGDCDALRALKKTKLPYLFIHGSEDSYVPVYMAYQNYNACASEDKELLLIEGAKHADSYFTDADTYETAVTDFINRHIV